MSEQIEFITLAQAARSEPGRAKQGGRGRTSQWRARQDDPDYPKVVWHNGRPYLLKHEHQRYLEKLVERGRSAAEPEAKPRQRVKQRLSGSPP